MLSGFQTGETPYHCNLCPKKFYDSNGLKRHRQVHERDGTLNEHEQGEIKTEMETYKDEIEDSSNLSTDHDRNESVIMSRPIGRYIFQQRNIEVETEGGTVIYTIP